MKTALYLAAKVKQQTGDDIDPKFFNFVAQIAHFGAWFFVMILCSTVSNKLHHQWIGSIVAVCANVPYATWHEFFWDPVHENAATRGSDLEDFSFLLLGAVVGFFVYLLLILK
jgi:VanZ family protein